MKTITKSTRTILLAAAALVVLAALTFVIWKFTLGASPKIPEADYWPTQGWLTSTPEEQGLDSAKLAEGLRADPAEEHSHSQLAHHTQRQGVAGCHFLPLRRSITSQCGFGDQEPDDFVDRHRHRPRQTQPGR